MSLPLEEFLERLERSGLMSSHETQTVADGLSAETPSQTSDQFADLLVERGALTRFQAQQILAGNGDTLSLGNYLILGKLGQGGMGEVFRAKHRRMNRIVALKVLPTDAIASPDLLHRFEREIEAAAKLNHPHIVTAYDADVADGIHFLVMEYVEGKDLASLVKRNGPLSTEKAVAFIIQAARGLAAAHAVGIVHRDVKPSNLLLDTNGVVKVADFGLARLHSSGSDGYTRTRPQLTHTSTVLGTVDFLAPEQARNLKQADHRADIYSLGCTLYYLLTGKPVYPGKSMMEKVAAHLKHDIPALEVEDGEVPSELNAEFQRMLAKQPQDRPQSMEEVVQALVPFDVADHSSSGYSSPSLVIRTSPAGRKKTDHKTRIAAIVGVAAACLVGILGFAYYINRGTSAGVALKSNEPVQEDASPEVQTPPAPTPNEQPTPESGTVTPTQPPVNTETSTEQPTGNTPPPVNPPVEEVVEAANHLNARDRVAAEWVIASGGSVRLVSLPKYITSLDELPQGECRLWDVNIHDARGVKLPGAQLLIGLPSIEIVSFHGSNADGSVVRCLSDCPRLMSLSITSSDIRSSGLVGLERLKGLYELRINAGQIDDNWEFLDRLPYLQRVVLFHKPTVPPEGLLARHPRLQTLYLASCTEEDRELLDAIKQDRPDLRIIIDEGAPKFVADGSRTSFANSLIEAGVAMQGITLQNEPWYSSQTPAFPVDMFHVTMIKLPPGNQLTDEQIRLLPRLSENKLQVWATQFAQPGRLVRAYAESGVLQSFFAPDSDLNDTDLAVLAIMPHLQHINVIRTQVSRAGVEDFVARVPGCRVESDFGTFQPQHRLPEGWQLSTPLPAVAPFTADEASESQLAWAQHLGKEVEFTNSLEMPLRVIPPGAFMMGTSDEQISLLLEEAQAQQKAHPAHVANIQMEGPQHRVLLTQPFAVGVHEVTLKQFRQFLDAVGDQPTIASALPDRQEWDQLTSHHPDDYPAIHVSWHDAVAFCNWLSEAEGVTYRLPTEAEWEYACRAGTTTRYHFGDDVSRLAEYAHPTWIEVVGLRKANPFGLYDLLGNAVEWCHDSHSLYPSSLVVNPTSPERDGNRMLRDSPAQAKSIKREVRAAYRINGPPTLRNAEFGFRVVCTFEPWTPPAAAAEPATVDENTSVPNTTPQ